METPHTFIQTPNRAVGFYASLSSFKLPVGTGGVQVYQGAIASSVTANIGLVGLGEAIDNITLIGSKGYIRSEQYSACPETLALLEKSINDNLFGIYSLTNIGGLNCAGWACKRLENAGFKPPATYWRPFLAPVDLVDSKHIGVTEFGNLQIKK